jgi:hypothetical protein
MAPGAAQRARRAAQADGPAGVAPPGAVPGWLAALEKCRGTLDEVGRALEDYLEAKRTAFPRQGVGGTGGPGGPRSRDGQGSGAASGPDHDGGLEPPHLQ